MEAPAPLTALLARLALATPAQVQGVAKRVRRLARELPEFESVWVDALAQAGVLTPYQAAQLNTGHGEELAVGPYILSAPLGRLGYARTFRAQSIDSGDHVLLTIFNIDGIDPATLSAALEGLTEQAAHCRHEGLQLTTGHGSEADRVWAVAPWLPGHTAADWLIHYGRFAPASVVQVALQMCEALAAWEALGQTHGDIRAQTLLLARDRAWLSQAGIRALVRPTEGFTHALLPVECYDGLAPERVLDGSAPTVASDLYSAGALWWHLLTGRPALAGGSALVKFRAAQQGNMPDVRRWAPDTPGVLAETIAQCLDPEPTRRPKSWLELADRLQPFRWRSTQKLRSRFQADRRFAVGNWHAPARPVRPRLANWPTALLIVAAIGLATWPLWRQVARRDLLAASAVHVPVASQPAEPKQPSADTTTDTQSGRPAASTGDPTSARPTVTSPDVLLELPPGAVLPMAALELRPGLIVRGSGQPQSAIHVTGEGLPVRSDDVRFEHIDFVWKASNEGTATEQGALVRLEADRATFSDCTFAMEIATGTTGELAHRRQVAAIRWQGRAPELGAAALLPTGRITLERCHLAGVQCAVDAGLAGAMVLELAEVLYRGHGPLVRLGRAPGRDDPVTLSLHRTTLRDCGSLLEMNYGSIPNRPGRLAIETVDCVLALRAQSPLVLYSGAERPTPLLATLSWTGQGTLLGPRSPLVVWRDVARHDRAAREDEVRMEGLFRGALEFAGAASGDPATSCVVHWEGPRLSTRAPGINAERVPRLASE